MKVRFLILLLISSLLFPLCAMAYEEELFCDEIFIESESLKLNLDKSLPKTYKETYKTPETGLEFKKAGISLFSNSNKSLDDYMSEYYKSTTGATLNPGGRLSLTGGMEVKYQNPDASINSKKLYLTPQIRLGEEVFVTSANKFNQDSKIYENEFGLKYAPKFFKNSNFGITAGTVFDEEAIKSQNLKFSTDLFLF